MSITQHWRRYINRNNVGFRESLRNRQQAIAKSAPNIQYAFRFETRILVFQPLRHRFTRTVT